MINCREALLDALQEAAELEHGLMLQYLFAALCMKKDLKEGITGEQQELIRRWEGQVLAVSREEMAHLGTVCNLLSAIGGAPRFGRPNFPQPAKEYYPFSFNLIPYCDEALYHFIRFELPKGEKPPDPPRRYGIGVEAFLTAPVPEPLEYEYVGELYGQIREAFNSMPEDTLFIGPRFAQDSELWSRRMQILRVVDRASANAAIDFIVMEGEGSPSNREGSHYDTFLKLRAELAGQVKFEPSRPVVRNPRTRAHRDAPEPGTLLTKKETVQVAELFNAAYKGVLLMLAQLYSFGGETLGERSALRDGARQMMTMCLRPLAEILTEMPATENETQGSAGPTFELYGPFQLSTEQPNRWTILTEQLANVAEDAKSLSQVNPRLAFIGENVELIRRNIQRAQIIEERL
jgi:hypothetical protein